MADASDARPAGDDAEPTFRILGPLSVAGAPALGGPRQRAVLGVLLLRAGRVVPAETIVTAVWGEDAPAAMVRTLRSYVSRLRRVVGRELLQPSAPGYVLAPDPDAVDAGRFERLLAEGRSAREAGDAAAASERLRVALALWRGRVLEDLPELASHPDVARLDELRILALEERVESDLALGRHAPLVSELESLVAEHPFHERFWEQLMLALYRSGRQADALGAYGRARSILGEELGLEPGPRLEELQRRVLTHEPALSDVAAEARTNLRLPVSNFVGRERELAEADELLREARLVTITGIGGGGKTRVALEAARRTRDRQPGGVWVVELAPLADGDTVRDEIAHALGAEAATLSPLEAAAARLGLQESLLVLDNAEHVLQACASAVEELLGAVPRLRVLVTSRRPLSIPGEVVYVLPALTVDGDGDAVRLFTTRAREAYPALELDDEALADVAAICRELDGIPLAIELAAARVRLLSPGEIRTRLAQNGVLGWPGGATAQRHRSLRAALDWSYDLLSERDRTTLRRLSVFAGSFTFEAAAAVAAPVGAEPVAAVGALVDASLLGVERGAPTRYRLLDTVRAYARELLKGDGEADDAARRHALHYLEVAERAAAATFAPAEDVLLMQVDAEHDELRAALAWSLGGGDLGLGLRLARALAWFWPTHGHTLEGRGWLERSLALADDAPDELRADLLGGLGTMAFRLAEHAEAQRLLEQAAALASAAGTTISHGRWLHNLAGAYRHAGDYARAQAIAEESLRVKRECGDVAGSAWTIGFLADTAQLLGELERAERLYDEGLELVHAAGDPPRLVVGYTASLAELALRRDRIQQAEELATEALQRAERLGERWHIATANAILGEAARRRGALDLADGRARAALREAWEIREMRVVPDALELLAAVAAERGAAEHAFKLLGAASAMRVHASAAPGALFSPAVDAARARAREQLGEEPLDRLTTEGEQLTQEQAVASALDGG